MKTTEEPYPHLQKWSHPKFYMGATWEGYYSSGFGRSRDSSTLEESNFQVVQRELAKLPEWEPPASPEDIDNDEEPISRQVIRESHWAVGWVEWTEIHESDTAALALCNKLAAKEEGYPVLDEEHWSQLEDEEAQRIWKDCYDDADRIRYMTEHRSDFEFRGFADMLGCARGKYFAGNAGDLCAR
jgi:hypothetical protein